MKNIYLLDAYPRKSKAIDTICQHVTEKRRVAIESWKVCMHIRTLPVSYLEKYIKKFFRKSYISIGKYLLVKSLPIKCYFDIFSWHVNITILD